ncbi:MAG: chorismate synthase [Clostridia bacterium]|nr:chorismate synthase [Clostridia bacterium]
MFNDNNVSVFNGKKLNIKVYGASHADKIGVVVDGFNKGDSFDKALLQEFCDRRKPKKTVYSTKRNEADTVNYLSGVTDLGEFDGNTLHSVIFNQDQRSKDYANVVKTPRPSHADFPAWVKYGNRFDYRGGGKFSGRMTAPICIAGGICKQLLQQKGISISAYVSQIGKVKGLSYTDVDPNVPDLTDYDVNFPLADNSFKASMEEEISTAAKNGDSVGGVVECVVTGVPVGTGEFMFDSIESIISHLAFGVPAIKGIEFGKGFALSALNGSVANDPLYVDGGKIKTKTNNNGGINGGLANGMPITFRVAVKPTPTILREQQTVNLDTMENVTLTATGRHDSCIALRVVPVIEAVAAIAIYDVL